MEKTLLSLGVQKSNEANAILATPTPARVLDILGGSHGEVFMMIANGGEYTLTPSQLDILDDLIERGMITCHSIDQKDKTEREIYEELRLELQKSLGFARQIRSFLPDRPPYSSSIINQIKKDHSTELQAIFQCRINASPYKFLTHSSAISVDKVEDIITQIIGIISELEVNGAEITHFLQSYQEKDNVVLPIIHATIQDKGKCYVTPEYENKLQESEILQSLSRLTNPISTMRNRLENMENCKGSPESFFPFFLSPDWNQSGYAVGVGMIDNMLSSSDIRSHLTWFPTPLQNAILFRLFRNNILDVNSAINKLREAQQHLEDFHTVTALPEKPINIIHVLDILLANYKTSPIPPDRAFRIFEIIFCETKIYTQRKCKDGISDNQLVELSIEHYRKIVLRSDPKTSDDVFMTSIKNVLNWIEPSENIEVSQESHTPSYLANHRICSSAGDISLKNSESARKKFASMAKNGVTETNEGITVFECLNRLQLAGKFVTFHEFMDTAHRIRQKIKQYHVIKTISEKHSSPLLDALAINLAILSYKIQQLNKLESDLSNKTEGSDEWRMLKKHRDCVASIHLLGPAFQSFIS